ncbi:MAG: outer membrane beta-barrel protein [Bacteroidota bacterium]
MKKVLLIVLIFFCLGISQIQGQIFKAQLIAGANVTQVDGDEVYGFKKWGGNFGLGVIFPVSKNKKWMVSLETIYNQKGAIQRRTSVDTFPEPWKYRLFLDYVETPVMLHIEDKDSWTLGLGFSWGRLIGIKEYENGKIVDSTTTTSGVYARSDWNFLADVRFRIWRQLKFNFRWAYSLVPIRDRYFIKTDHSRNQYNSMMTIRLIYVINEKKEIKRKKDKVIEP